MPSWGYLLCMLLCYAEAIYHHHHRRHRRHRVEIEVADRHICIFNFFTCTPYILYGLSMAFLWPTTACCGSLGYPSEPPPTYLYPYLPTPTRPIR
ncbi:hypothetical protein F5Y11DRAFT_232764 [Daldinia sp. FL1419]|nr:hypothetical protein F5Y11DRAFT_232764 [Daldinia sp. FL1419]